MKRNIILYIVGTLAVLSTMLLMTGRQDSDSEVVSVMEASYPVYETLADLTAQSSLVIRGKVTKVLPSYRVVPDNIPMDQLPAHKAANVGYAMTDVEIKVQRVIAGAPEFGNTTILVSHLGGQVNGQNYVMEDEPLSTKGRSYVFFLEQAEPGRYVIVGGPQGRYQVNDRKLASLSKHAQQYPVNRFLETTDLNNLEQNFSTVIAQNRPQPQQPEREEPLSPQPDIPAPQNKPQGPPQ